MRETLPQLQVASCKHARDTRYIAEWRLQQSEAMCRHAAEAELDSTGFLWVSQHRHSAVTAADPGASAGQAREDILTYSGRSLSRSDGGPSRPVSGGGSHISRSPCCTLIFIASSSWKLHWTKRSFITPLPTVLWKMSIVNCFNSCLEGQRFGNAGYGEKPEFNINKHIQNISGIDERLKRSHNCQESQ